MLYCSEETREKKKFLYKLQELNIAVPEKVGACSRGNPYKWFLTSKGKALIEKNPVLKQYWDEEKFKEFFEQIQNNKY